jgi:hypothetical protein
MGSAPGAGRAHERGACTGRSQRPCAPGWNASSWSDDSNDGRSGLMPPGSSASSGPSRRRVRRCLASLGFEPYTASVVPWAGLPHSQVFRDRIGRHVDVHPVSLAVRTTAGQGTAVLTEDAFSTGSIAGHPVGCLSPEVQRAFHRGYPPRDQDLQDLATLRAVLARRGEREAPPELPAAVRSFGHRHDGAGSGHDRDRSLDPGAPGTT